MLNPIATEALFSATYVDNYIDSVENLPDDVQRYLSRIRDIDVQYRSHLRDVDHYYELWKTLNDGSEVHQARRTRSLARMQHNLIQAQELGDEKMQIVNQLQELIDAKTRQLDTDQKNLNIKEDMQQQQNRYDNIQQYDDLAAGSGPTPHKLSRLQSPSRGGVGAGDQILNNCNNNQAITGKEHAFINFSGSGSCGSNNGGSTPNSERSSNNSNSAMGGAGNNGLMLNGNQMANTNGGVGNGGEVQRTGSKRSRRRNESLANSSNGTMELGGNESNSANETGSLAGSGIGGSGVGGVGGGNERSLTHKSTSSGSTTQKKNSTHHGHHSSSAGDRASGSGVGGSGSGGGSGNSSSKKKKRKARGAANAQTSAREETPPPEIDPDEPTYCVCNQISFGEMILCDNDLCPIEWFHFSCVSLVLKPKGKWYCPNCRGDRPNVMKPKAQFLKELERYNKEKEEKT